MAADLARCGVAHTETQWVSKDGSLFNVDLRFASLDPADPTAGGIFTILDISERKRIEQSLELMQFSMDSTDVIIPMEVLTSSMKRRAACLATQETSC